MHTFFQRRKIQAANDETGKQKPMLLLRKDASFFPLSV